MCMITESIAHKRKELGLTQQKLAELAHVSLPTIQKIESGKCNPSLDILMKIFKILGYKLELTTEEIDWDLLAQLGLPLTPSKRNHVPLPTRQVLILECRKVLAVATRPSQDRRTEALVATLLALKSYWPSAQQELGVFQKTSEQLMQRMDQGRLLKLRPLAAKKLHSRKLKIIGPKNAISESGCPFSLIVDLNFFFTRGGSNAGSNQYSL
jgi:transcriptional regulator with XRE-family HTH domain